MIDTGQPFRFSRITGFHHVYEFRRRGKWSRRWVFSESKDPPDEKAIRDLKFIPGCAAIRRGDGKQVIWEKARP